MPSNRRKTRNRTRGHGRSGTENSVRVENHPPVHRGNRDRRNESRDSSGESRVPLVNDFFHERSAASHRVAREYNEDANDGTREPSPSSLSPSADSGFTSPSRNESNQEESASPDGSHSPQEGISQAEESLKKLGIELKVDPLKDVDKPLPRRPGFGTLGTRIKLISNCFPVEFPKRKVYHYDVEVYGIEKDPEVEEVTGEARRVERYRCLKTREKRRVIESMVKRDAIFDGLYPAYDGEKNLYTRRALRASFPHTFTTADDDEIRARVDIKPVKRQETSSCAIDLSTIHAYYEKQVDSVPQDAIAALETILRHCACLTLTPIGRSFFSPPSPGCQNPLAGGLELWFGYHQSVRLGQWKPTVNIDIAATTFYPGGPLLEYIAGFLDTTVDSLRGNPILSDSNRRRLSNRLKDKKVEATHSNVKRKYTIMRLERENAHNLRLDAEDENSQTVVQYFYERYKIDLEYPNLPCLRAKPENRNVYLPIELCNLIPGQHYNKELTQAQKAEMIKFTSPAPRQRFQEIRNKLNFNNDKCAQEFNIGVSKNPLPVEGRTLDPPSLIYRGEKKIRPRDGTWNMRDSQFAVGAEVKSWVLLSFADIQERYLRTFGKLLKERGRELGVRIDDPKYTRIILGRFDTNELFSTMKKEEVGLVVVVIPDLNEDIYKDIKKSAETEVGLITQCIMEKTVRKVTDPRGRGVSQLLANLFLKINSKMGGINYSLILSEIPSILWKPTIIIGADVNHPGACRGLKDSLAACAGSLDARCSLYAVRSMQQKNEDSNKKSIEIILDLQSMVADLLRAFYQRTRKYKPEKIIIYRDGVSEGEFLKVRDQEVRSVRKACKDLSPDYEPGITFIVVQKRHHLRFMTEGSNLNIPPDTVIDTEVTHPENFDFFLCSQKCPKGTAKPAHYTVIEDDNGFTANDLQKFTNQLCYSYVRCTKSISIPAPVAYAHLAAYRARQYLEAGNGGSAASSSDQGWTGGLDPSRLELIDCTTVVKELRNKMYFV